MPDPIAIENLARYAKLKARWDGTYGPLCQRVAEFIQPQKAAIVGLNAKSVGGMGWVDNLFDMTGAEANNTLAAGLVTLATPATQRWAAFTLPARLRPRIGNVGAVDRWCQHVTEVIMRELAGTNFYSRVHECHLDRNSFAKCALFAEDNVTETVVFHSLPVGSYVIAEGLNGKVDTVMRVLKFTVRQAVARFGKDKLSEKTRATADMAEGKGQDEEVEFLHSIYPNPKADPKSAEPKDRRWKSCFIEKAESHTVEESGYNEMPIAVSRFEDWSGEIDGWCPAFLVLPVVRQVNFLEAQMDALAEQMAFPPTVQPDTMAGQVDLRAGGVNTVSADDLVRGAYPRPLHTTTGREYDVGKDRVEEKREFIRRAYHNDLFRLFSDLEKDVTAYEASQMAGEKLDQLAPMWQRLTGELLTPTLTRVFAIFFRAGMFDAPPRELLDEQGRLPVPEVAYLSRIALAMQYHEIQSLDQLFARAQQLGAVDPALAKEFLRPYKLDGIARTYGKNLGVPVSLQKTEKEVAAEIAAEAEQAQAMMAAEAAPQLAKAAKDASETNPSRIKQLMGAN